MRSRLRLGAAASSVAFALSLIPALPAAAAESPFADAQASAYTEAIAALAAKGVLKGYPDGTFRPAARINRAEFLKIILEARGMRDSLEQNCFPDVKTEWFAQYVCAAKKEGIVGGYPDGTFKPEQDIAFTEAAKILSLAYGQQIEQSGEWYQGYALALESSKAIPVSVNALDEKLSRDEMAEMMWRLSENKTDEPTKGYLNVKYPHLAINTASDDVQTATACADLQVFMLRESTENQNMYYMRDSMGAPAAAESDGAQLQKSVGTGGGSDDYSNTNLQVEGVDEGDIVKTDGTNLYVLSQGVVRILKANPGSNLQKLSEISFASQLEKESSGSDEYWSMQGGFQPSDLYIENGKLIVLGHDYNSGGISPLLREKQAADSRMMIWPPYGMTRTVVKIYDVSNASSPKEIRTVAFDGNTVSSRRIGDKFYLVMNAPLRQSGMFTLEEKNGYATDGSVPMMEDSATGKVQAVAPCSDVRILPRVPSPQYLIVSVIPLNDAKGEVQNSVVLGNAHNIYMSTESLYVASTDYQYNWQPVMEDTGGTVKANVPTEQTRLYRFRIAGDGVDYAARGEVPGHILNQFSMDEHGSTFRIATTLSQDWSNPQSRSSNALYTLSRDLSPLGEIEGIAPGESIFAARFLGNRVYLVTFKQVDPLFVLDTSDARNPKILGKLKIPGYSNYLHPIDETHVLGIGKEVDESIDAELVHSDDAVYYTAIQGVKLAVFDVRDVSNPKELHKEVIGDRGSDTPVTVNHKALLYEPEKNLLALPMFVTKRPAGSEKNADGQPVFQGAYVYDLSVSGGFDLRGTITHYDDNSDFLKSGSYWYGSPSDIQRIVRIGNSLLTVSDGEIRSSTLSGLKEEASVTYPVKEQSGYPVLY